MVTQEILELNNKLARWRWSNPKYDILVGGAGIKVFKSPSHPSPMAQCDLFTQSTDACFKWLVPKLHAWELRKDFHPDNTTSIYCWCSTTETDAEVSVSEYTPALAICKAIEKLM